MHWYGGSIAEAVNLSKQKNAIFVVFVEGENEMSVEMAATIDDSVVLDRLSDQTNFLAVKLKSGSANYIHFAQIYQFVPVPSLFFIGRNGTPLEVVCAGVEPGNLATRIDRILGEHFKDKEPSSSSPGVQAATSSTNISPAIAQPSNAQPATAQLSNTQPATAQPSNTQPATAQPSNAQPATAQLSHKPLTNTQSTVLQQQTVSFVQTEQAAMLRQTAADEAKVEPGSASGSPPAKIAKPNPAAAAACEGGVCTRRPGAAAEPGPSQAPTPSLPDAPGNTQESLLQTTESIGSVEEKMERAKELIEARRREKADKEKELEKEKEIERRQAGKGVAELKRWQADQELKQIQEERRREKMENNLERQRILEQIAQDRAERRARDHRPAAPAAPASGPAPASAPAAQPAASSGDGGRARIQFKLPDGTSHTAHFDSEGTLRDVQRYVADNLRLSTSSFALWTAFPRRELTDAEASLQGLQLAPSAALLVLPRRTAAIVARPSAVSSLITFFTQLFTTIILTPSQNIITWLRTRLFPPPPSSGRRAAPPPGPRGPAPPAPPAAPPAPPGGPPAVRRRGNIHRLPSDRTPDDDNNTWNGNSTQQM